MHKIEEIKRGLDDLKRSAETDIKPIINIGSSEGGYFGVTRSVLSYVDYLGALYGGYDGSVDRSGRRKIATPKKATTFIKDIFGQIYRPYSLYGELMYKMYRHGTVHLYRPHTLKNPKGEVLEWLTYKGGDSERKGYLKYEHKLIFVHHMIPQRFAYERHVFPVAIDLLYEDLLLGIDLYLEKIKKSETLAKNYSDVINALLLPEDSSWSIF